MAHIKVEFSNEGEYSGIVKSLNKKQYLNKNDDTLTITFDGTDRPLVQYISDNLDVSVTNI